MTDLVTGAFSYSGAAIAAELHRRGRLVRTMTAHPQPASTTEPPIDAWPLKFSPGNLNEALDGVDTLYNTYWARFPATGTSYQLAVTNSARLFQAAATAGVRRIVHVSITHADSSCPYPYFKGKGQVEAALDQCGVPYAIARPAFLFGQDGILMNNVAWMLRHLPAVPVGDDGTYLVRGIHVDDLAALCVRLADGEAGTVVDAVGPDRLSFRELLTIIRDAVAPSTPIVSVPGRLLVLGARLLAPFLRDQLITGEEYGAMRDGLADSSAPPTGEISFRDWVAADADRLGVRYLNDTAPRRIVVSA